MDSLISFTDLFDAQFVTDINKLKTALHGLMGELKNVSASVQASVSSSSASSSSLEQLSKQVAALEQAYKTLKEAKTTVDNATKNMANLNNNERESVEQLKVALERLAAARNFSLREIDTEKKSYNELKASFNAIEDALRSMTKEERENTAAGQSMTKEAQSIITAMKNMDNAYKRAAQSAKSLNDVQKRFSKLQPFEATNVENFVKEIDNVRQSLNSTLPAIDMQHASYNQLYAMYNVLKDALNQMTVEQRESTAAGQSMTKQAHDLMMQLNQLQQATGKYTLNVGNYASAFDGFGYSIQQVLREIPSATTLNQFILAISNNIPMVADQIRKFTTEQTRLHEEANKAMQAGNKEAADAIAAQYESLGKKIIKSVWNWQSAILVALLLLKNYGTQAVQYIINLFSKAKDVAQAFRDEVEKMKFFTQIKRDTAEIKTELEILQKIIDNTTKGTDEWKNAIMRVNELTKSNLDFVSATPDEVKKVTQAYIEQARQIAINNAVVKKIAESDVNEGIRQNIVAQLQAERQRRKQVFAATGGYGDLSQEVLLSTVTALGLEKGTAQYRKYERWINKYTKGKAGRTEDINEMLVSLLPTLSGNLRDYYESLLQPLPETEKDKGSRSSAEKEFKLMEDLYKTYMQERYKIQQDGFKREQQQENDRFELQKQEDEEQYYTRLFNFQEALKKAAITEEDYQLMKEQLREQFNGIVEAHEQEHYDNLAAIKDKYDEIELKEEQDRINTLLEMYEKQAEAELRIRKKRVKNAKDEIYNNKVVTDNINTYLAAIEKLKKELEELEVPDEGETAKKINEAIQKYTENINKEIANYSTSQQTKKFNSLWDVFLGGVSFSGDFKKGVLEKMGIDTSKIEDEEILEGLFQNWMDETASSMKDWASIMKDTLSDVLSAVVEFYKAKAEAAAEDTEHAKEEYEKQKALMEAGYASSIETEWQAYQEKKVIQQQAEKEAEAWNLRQRQLSQLETVASLGTAIANLFKSMSAAGAVGVALAMAAAGAMLASYQTAQGNINGIVKYGDGHVEKIGGGSHASGHDSPLAVDSRGRQRRVEGGEMFAVINRRAVRKYGDKAIADMITQINARNLQIGVDDMKVASVAMDLSTIEKGIGQIVANGSEKTYTDANGNVIIRRGNFTRKIINSMN